MVSQPRALERPVHPVPAAELEGKTTVRSAQAFERKLRQSV